MFEETCESFLGLRACASQEMPMPFLYDMTKVDLVDTEARAGLLHTLLLPLLCRVQNRKPLVPWCMQPPSATTFAMAHMEPMFQGRRPRN